VARQKKKSLWQLEDVARLGIIDTRFVNLERIQEYVLPVTAVAVSVGIAMYLGRLAGNEQFGMLMMIVLGFAALFLVLGLRTRIWLLVPMCWPLAGQIPTLPLPFTVRHLVVMSIFCVVLAFVALKMLRPKLKFDFLDFLLFLNLTYLASVFIRNPVGSMAFDSDRVGGRPYFEIFISFLAYLILHEMTARRTDLRWMPLFVVAGNALQAFVEMMTHAFPQIVPFVSRFYTGISTTSYAAQGIRAGVENTMGRKMYLSQIGTPLTTALLSYFQPLTLISPLYFWRALLFGIGCLCLLFSGFRSSVITVGFLFLLSSYIRKGFAEVFRVAMIGLPLLALVVFAQGTMIELPRSIQRALSFLPGKWDEAAVLDAQGSAQWRFQMWDIVLKDSKYIDNRLLGDGFGFSRQDMAMMEYMAAAGMDDNQENSMIVGSFHSGPISAIRYVGYIGLALYTWLLLAMARRALRLARKTQSTPYFAGALFISLPIIYEPFNYWIVFGGFDSSFPNTIFHLGLLKMMENSLEFLNVKPPGETAFSKKVWRKKRPAFAEQSPVEAMR
jgi:hypothetical protein